MNDIDQFFGAPGARTALMIRIDHVHPDMVLDDLRHEAVHCAARSDDQMKDVRAALFFLDRAFKRLHLAANTSPPNGNGRTK